MLHVFALLGLLFSFTLAFIGACVVFDALDRYTHAIAQRLDREKPTPVWIDYTDPRGVRAVTPAAENRR